MEENIWYFESQEIGIILRNLKHFEFVRVNNRKVVVFVHTDDSETVLTHKEDIINLRKNILGLKEDE